MSETTAPYRTLELFVRSLSSSAMGVRIDDVLDQLDRLQAGEHFDEYTVTVWGERVSAGSIATRTDEGAFIRSRTIEFRQWARDHDITLEGGFETQTGHSAITGETHEFITLPSMVLAARREGALEWIVPSSQDEEVTSVWDRLSALERTHRDPEQEKKSIRAADV